MIIECPACTTRYDIKATLPPEGRTVRCAKCETVWRAMPDAIGEVSGGGDDRENPNEAPSTNGAADNSNSERQRGMGQAARGQTYEQEWTRSAAGEFPREERAAFQDAAPSEHLSDEQEGDDPSFHAGGVERIGRPDDSEITRDQYPEADQDPEPDQVLGQDQDLGQDRDTGKVRWFGTFRRKNGTKEKKEANIEAALSRTAGAEPIPFPRSSFAEERQQVPLQGEELRTLEEARQAVRSVFSSLGDVRSSTNARGFSARVTAQVPEEGASHEESADSRSGWSSGTVYGEAPQERSDSARLAEEYENGDDQGYYRPASATADRHTNGQGHQSNDDDEWNGLDGEVEGQTGQSSTDAWRTDEEDASSTVLEDANEETPDPDAQLRDAMRAKLNFFQSSASEEADSAGMGDALAQELETHLRSAPSTPAADADWKTPTSSFWKRPSLPLDHMPERRPFTEDESNEIKDDDAVFDQRLYREIEATQEHPGETRRREGSGGLALAAAWGLFLCAAGGLITGLFSFRDMAADAMPGLAPLYRSLGMPVTVQPLIFESVQYDWRVSDNKPTLVISGSVYNRSQRKVKVPEFFITIKDQDPALDREYSANLQVSGSKIKSDKRADFEIELLSPNPTITAVELELRNVH